MKIVHEANRNLYHFDEDENLHEPDWGEERQVCALVYRPCQHEGCELARFVRTATDFI